MNKKRLFLLTLTSVIVTLIATAAPRTQEQMKQAALRAINKERAARRMAPRQAVELQTLKSTSMLAVIGHQQAGFAVIAKDDSAPEVLGVSTKHYSDGQNSNFQWWLRTMNQVVEHAAANNIQMASIAPDPSKYPTSVAPMMTTEWDQTTPYNNLCPTYSAESHCLTGCVATALAQVLNYFRTPAHGIGTRTIYYPHDNTNGQAVTADFENTYYDWDNMLDNYNDGYTNEQALAVATLMRDCGVAADMQYGDDQEGSGAYSDDAAAGLRQYFGFSDAQCYMRDNGYGSNYYSDQEWMDMVFRALSEDGPIYYGGVDSWMGGHAFVLHGYNAQGQVYVNWGWSGDDDGYYDISLLNPSLYQFSTGQDMIIGVKGEPRELTEETVTLSEAGTLSAQITDEMIGTVGTLKVTGDINSTDLLQLRKLAGTDEYGERTQGYLQHLDLSEARIVAGGNAYLVDGSRRLTTESDNTLPERAFYGCRTLKTLTLPAGFTSWGKGALALCPRLESIQIGEAGAGADFQIMDGIVWNPEQTEIIAVLPSTTGELEIPKGTTALADYALAGCSRLQKVVIPATLTQIGREAFRQAGGLQELRVLQKEPPTLTGAGVFEGLTACTLYVPAGSKEVYERKAQWNSFTGRILEFGSAVKVRNTIRKYGEENPTFVYTVSGDAIQGEPVLTCEATPSSPAGRYPITLSLGTITDEFVELIDGYLVVQKVDATATVLDATREQGQPNPDFELQFEGLVLNETVPVWTEEPQFSCEANESSEPGQYPITCTAKAESYNISFVAGTLTVTESTTPTGISLTQGQETQHRQWTAIDGRQLNGKPAQRGVYIINGRKVVK